MYYSRDIEDIRKELNTNIENGLTEKEASNRLLKNGENVLPAKKRPSILKLFLEEFTSPIEIILVVTVLISFLIGEIVDAIVIIFIILIDTIMGTYQENKALKSAEALTKLIKVKTKVIRDGKEKIIDSEELVVGDILILGSGDKITADARVIESYNLQVDESILTGESMSATKNKETIKENVILAERSNILHAGTNIMTGRCRGVVVSTGINTEIGKIATKVTETEEEKSPLTIRIDKLSKQISILIIVVSIISCTILFANGYEIKAIFLTVVALAVSAMPEGLPLALTMALTIASNRMSKKNVIVKKLNSVESLGSCTIIASDKTGTLTVNEQTARKIILKDKSVFEVTGTGYNAKGEIIPKGNANIEKAKFLIDSCAINNEATFKKVKNEYKYHGDSIDIAFLALKEKMGESSNIEVKKIIPYESDKQYSAAFYEKDGVLHCTVKGSLEKIMSFSQKRELYITQNEELSKEGYRVIAVCDGIVENTEESSIKNLDFLGMVAFIDPIREEAKASIEECHNAGIKVVMITGDHPLTAAAIAKELNLVKNESEVVTGTELEQAFSKGEKYFDSFIKNKKVFSRVTPTDKLNIVQSYKRMGEFVAVTGDGVNDAPAIKSANIGIAMGSGTDVAKETASMIIVDDNFKTIVEGIKEGRIAYANIKKIVLFLLSCGMAEVLFCLLSIVAGYDIPLLAIQLLWINVVTDGLQDIALSFETSSKDVMQEKPRPTNESILSKELLTEVIIFGLTIAFMIFSAWKHLIDKNTEILLARSIIMMIMVFIQNVHVLNCRSEKESILRTKLSTNPLVVNIILGSILLQLIVTEIPFLANKLSITSLPFITILTIFIYSLIIIFVAEIYKIIYRQQSKQYKKH